MLNEKTINGIMTSCIIGLWIDATCRYRYRNFDKELFESGPERLQQLSLSIPVESAVVALLTFHTIIRSALDPVEGATQGGAEWEWWLMAALMSMLSPDRLFQAVEKLSDWWCGEEVSGNGADINVAEQALGAKS